jgi:hypothetical protein
VLTIKDIQELATRHPLRIHGASDTGHAKKALTVWFEGEAPDAWEMLMSNNTEVDVRIFGTRSVTGSGSTDDRLLPVYAERLPRVNARRAELGLKPAYV